ncbi:MAG: Flp family type IVb pilin [Rhizobiales bacterium]|nr:Flp family type IVb pilin [Hyphomicrobiales bacterium]
MRSFITRCRLHRCQRSFAQDKSGATAIEYALIASGVSVAIVGALTMLGTQIMVVFYDKLNNLF